MKTLHYRPADDAFVIKDGDAVIAETNATDVCARKTLDPAAAAIGLRRFLTFADWQAKAAGSVLWPGSPEDAMARAPRL